MISFRRSSMDSSMDPSKKQLIASVFAGRGEIGARMRALDWLSCFSERAFLSAD